MREGFGIVDGGATRTLGSVEAIKSIAAMNQQRHQDDRIPGVDLNDRPVFGFGNSSKDQCVSTLQVKITAGQKEGALKIHALDKGNGPVLLSVATLRSLKAVIDFEQDLVVLRGLDPHRVVPLERSQAGHQLLDLTSDFYRKAYTSSEPVPSLRDFCVE